MRDKPGTFKAITRAGTFLSPYLSMTAFDLRGLLNLIVVMNVEEGRSCRAIMCTLCRAADLENPQCKALACQ